MSNRLRKGLATFMTGATVLWSVGAFSFTVSVASAAAEDIIKSPSGSSVYMVLSDGESICRLVTEGHYDMFAMYKAKGLKRWQDVQTVDTSTFTDKGVCSLRVGSLVRTKENAEVFVIQTGMMKRGFDSWDTYVKDGYKSGGVYYVTDEVLSKYTTGAKITSAITSGEIREGQLIKWADSATVYYVAKEGSALVKREVVNEKAYSENFGINWNLVITIPSSETYTTSTSQITGADTSINRPVAAGTAAPALAGTVTFTLASDTPSGTLAPNKSYGNVFTKYVLSAGSDTTITSIKVKRDGLGARADFSSVYLYVDGAKFTTARTFNSDDSALFSLGAGLMVKANMPVKLDIVADMGAITATGQHKLGIAAASDVTTNGTVSGTFPLMGNFISTSTTAVGEMVVKTKNISDTEIFVGEQQQELSRFEFMSGSAEKVRLNSIRFRNTGSAKLADYSNFALYKGGTKVDGIETMMNGDYLTVKNINLTFDKSQTILIKLYGDVIGGANSTIQFSIEEAADVSATGLSFGYGVTINNATGATTWSEQKSNGDAVTILAGELTFAITGPAAYAVDLKKDDVVASTLAITAPVDETITITKMYAYIEGTEGAGLAAKDIEKEVENIQLIQKTGGTQVIDATASDGTANDNKSFYFANFDVKGATTWDVIFDTNDSEVRATDKFKFIMIADDDSATVGDNASVTPVEAKNSSGKSLTSSTRDDIKPATTINGNSVTLQAVDLTVTGITLGNDSAVAKQTNIPLIKLQLIAGTAGDVKITQMKFENTASPSPAISDPADGSLDVSNFSMYEVMADATEKLVQSGKSASAAASTFTVIFNSLNNGTGIVLKKDETKTVLVKADFTAGISSGEKLAISASTQANGGIVAEKVSDGNTLADSNIIGNVAVINGRQVTAQTSGRLITSLAENNNTDAPTTQVLAGTKGVKTMYIKFNADYEDVNLKTLKLNLVNTSANDSVDAVYLYDGTTKILAGTYVEGTSDVTFGNGQTTFAMFSKDMDKVLTVVTDLRQAGTGSAQTADSGDEVKWRIDAETAADTNGSIVATGVSSNNNLVYKTDGTVAANTIFFGTTLTDTNQADNDLDSNIFHVRRALITDITALRSGDCPIGIPCSLVNSNGVELFRFKITAAADTVNQNGAIDLTALKLTTSASGVSLTNAKIYRTDIAQTTVNASTTTQDTGSGGSITFSSTLASGLANISPGASATFVVTADVSAASAGESVQVSIANLGAQSTENNNLTTLDLTVGAIVWSDNDNDNTIADDLTSWTSWPGITINNVLGQTRLFPPT